MAEGRSGTASAASAAAAGTFALAPVFVYLHQDRDHSREEEYAYYNCGNHLRITLLIFYWSVCAGRTNFSIYRVIFLSGTHQQVDPEEQQRGGEYRPDGDAPALCDQTQLVDDEGHRVGEAGLVADRDAGPFRAVHLALDCSHRSEAGGAEKVEDHEGVGGERRVVGRKLPPDFFSLFGDLGEAKEDAEGADDVFFSDKSREGGDGGLPGTPAKGREYPGD